MCFLSSWDMKKNGLVRTEKENKLERGSHGRNPVPGEKRKQFSDAFGVLDINIARLQSSMSTRGQPVIINT